MKIAYIAYDRTCLKSYPYFAAHGHEVQYFLTQELDSFTELAFSEIDILVDGLLIPAAKYQRTEQQKKKYNEIATSYLELRSLIANTESISASGKSTGTSEGMPAVFNVNQINDVQIDPKQRKVFLELTKKGVESFDHLVIEGHPFVSDNLVDKKINIAKSNDSLKYVWSSLSFDIEFLQPLTPFTSSFSFFMVQDSTRKNVVDNWLLCQMKGDQIAIWTFLPIHQIKNPEFQKFYIERLKTAVGKKLDFLLFKKFRDFYFSTVGASASIVASMRGPLVTVPNFMYWGQAEVIKYIDGTLTKKLKVLQQQAEAKI